MQLIIGNILEAVRFEQAAQLLAGNFDCWSDIREAREELAECCAHENITVTALDGNNVIGLIGARPCYSGNVWELHPLVVDSRLRKKGIGRLLVEALEAEVIKKGGTTVYLGTDDEDNSTSLSNIDVYDNIYDRMENIKNLNNHPYEFYKKCGYTIVGIVPDANGYGKPDIMMAKRVK